MMKSILTLAYLLLFCGVASATDYVPYSKTVEYDARLFSGLNGYFSSQDHVSQQITNDRIDRLEGQLEILVKLLTEISGKLENGSGNNTPSPTDGDSGNDQRPNPPANEDGVDPTGDNGASELDVKVYEIFSNNCNQCHNPEVAQGGIVLVDKESQELFYQNLANRVNIFDVVNGVGLAERGKTAMPKGGTLSNEDVETIRIWMIEEADRERELNE